MTLATVNPTFEIVPIQDIDDPDLPARSEMNDESMNELVASIREFGLIYPLVVVRRGLRFRVIAGHRRRIACDRAGLPAVKCFIYPDTDLDLTVIQAHENSRREELNPADEATWFQELFRTHCGQDIDKLARLVGEKVSYVDDRLQLALGYSDVLAALKAGEIKVGAAHELNKITSDHYRNYYLKNAIRSGAPVTTVAAWVCEWKGLVAIGSLPEPGPLAAPSPSGSPAAEYFTCLICGKTNHVHTMQQLVVHGHCKLAILDPLLERAREG